MDNKTLTNTLVERGILESETAQKLLRDASLNNTSVESLLYTNRIVNEVDVAKAKSELLKVPYKEVRVENISSELLRFIPEETSRSYSVIPLSKTDRMLVVGMVYPDDVNAQNALRYIAKQLEVSLGVYLITPSVVEGVLRLYSPYQNEVTNALRSFGGVKDQPLNNNQRIVKLEEGGVSEDAPIIRIVASTLKEAVAEHASDIHLEPQKNRMRIRFRIDGVLREVSSVPPKLHQPIISRIKIMSNLKIDENRIPQDGRFRTVLMGRDIDFRVSSFPTPLGEKIALRVLDPTVGLKGLDALGLMPHNVRILETALTRPYGLILITGPTGSGKTTTIYSILQKLNNEGINIVSLEDPVEYFVESINQSQVRPEIGYDFISGLRQILRQDPDVVMVGEIRDKETASLVVHAALTGHIVISTLHTNDAIGVIPRLINMGIEPFLVPSALNLMVAQRLVPRLCDECKKEEVAHDDVQDIIKKSITSLPQAVRSDVIAKYKEPYRVFQSEGCKSCNNKGSRGRVAIFEMLSMTRELGAMVNEKLTGAKLLDEVKRQRMVMLRDDGIIKALAGLVPIEEVLRETTES
ncbi:MAG: hypothetical protein A3A04_02355 [Candidatus Harrisonbacteria bacterium RIFCSPLOWO2_01_FULL_40_28]|uniref:Bacterial type II secretion system protein E domain-containing protein n=1 Tax=Candidatus Harrisonbacteria bacterium RIFCSPLOWO2_01_FULL_40_28 TaxID=1798406 RepID=A0A1G1ZR20_9BACT|nr:MAG: hypothetical protein A3A04_02355 [Candidatus Harrisonbacteria bacterium RIFCSPLOWO2_01_FULL_40_28]